MMMYSVQLLFIIAVCFTLYISADARFSARLLLDIVSDFEIYVVTISAKTHQDRIISPTCCHGRTKGTLNRHVDCLSR